MRIKHHIDTAELMSCASGSQPEAVGAVIATHLSMCPHCRHELKIHSLIGETLFQDIQETPLNSDRLLKFPQKNISTPSSNSQSQNLHVALWLIESGQKDKINWKPSSPGVLNFSFPLSKESSGTLKLIRLSPKSKLPHFEGSGNQLILLLDGSLNDIAGSKHKGDILQIAPHDTYSLVANENEGCIFLLGAETSLELMNASN